MHHRTGFGSVVLGIVVVFLFTPLVHAQLPPRLERCLPYPSLADEIRQTKAAKEAEAAPARKIVINTIQFDDGSEPPGAIQELLIEEIRSHSFEDRPGWTDELADVALRGVLQDRGYFRAYASASEQVLSRDAQYEHVL